ncbi:MAG: hypothetical protein J6B87_05965 [Clostridia bacterium]|nr:hypothetical protein [Clostridia bacterium]
MINSKGISMITLVITIIVMLILSSIVYVISNDGRESADNAKYLNEKKLLQEAMQSRLAGYLRNANTYPLEGTPLASSEDDVITQLENIGRETANTVEVKSEINTFLTKNISHAEYNRIINYTDMLALELTNISSDTNYSYIANYYSLDIIGPIK